MFALAIVLGYYVIGPVHHALYTPLMSVPNAIAPQMGIFAEAGELLELSRIDAAPSLPGQSDWQAAEALAATRGVGVRTLSPAAPVVDDGAPAGRGGRLRAHGAGMTRTGPRPGMAVSGAR